MDTFALAALLLVIMGGVTAQVQLQPQEAAVLQTSTARFNCSTTQTNWGIMNWFLNDLSVLGIVQTSGVIPGKDRFNATNYSTTSESKWEFSIKNVSQNDTGQVGCQILGGERVNANLNVQVNGSVEIAGSNWTAMEGDQVEFQCLGKGWFPEPNVSWTYVIPNDTVMDKQLFNTSFEKVGTLFNFNSTLMLKATKNVTVACLASIPALITHQRSTALLVVVNKPGKRDQTVLIAVTVSISAAVLLILIIIAIVYCCRRRKRAKSTYQEEVRARSQSQREDTGEEQGQDNPGYVTEPKGKDTNIWHTNNINNVQMPDVVNSNQRGNSHPENNVRKHRHVTIV